MIADQISETHAPLLERIITKWTPDTATARTRMTMQLLEWMNNFTYSECVTLLPLLEKIQKLTDSDISSCLTALAESIKKIFPGEMNRLMFFPLGDSIASSGARYLYYFKKLLGNGAIGDDQFPGVQFEQFDFKSEESKKTRALIFIDDIIGSGRQASKFYEKHLAKIPIDKYYLSLVAFEDGLKKVKEVYGRNKVIAARTLTEEDRAFSPRSRFFQNPGEREKIKTVCEKRGKELYPKWPLGFGDCQALIVFPDTVPNNTLPIIWAGPKSESNPAFHWCPLFERIKRGKPKEANIIVPTIDPQQLPFISKDDNLIRLTPGGSLSYGDLKTAGQVLASGGICVLPSDTGYSFAALPTRDTIQTFDEIFPEKKKDKVSLAFDSPRMVEQYIDLSREDESIMDHFPGPLTLVCKILDEKKDLANIVKSKDDGTLGVRIPDCVSERELSHYLNHPITTYAIRDDSNKIVQNFDDARDIIFERLKNLKKPFPFIFIGPNRIKYPKHSTVFSVHPDLIKDKIAKIFREGRVDEKEIIRWLMSYSYLYR